MGGGGQANKGQASQSFAGGQAASAQDMALSQQDAAYQKRMEDTLFGTPGAGGKPGTSGTLTRFLDPNSLKVSKPTGTYGLQWNQAQNQIGNDYANERGAIARNFANQGATSSSTPTGFMADQENKLARGEADTRGATFTDLAGKSYQDALNNFWNANNIASGNAATAGSGALQGAGQSGSVQDALYGTAGQYHASPVSNVLGSALGAGGTVGAAAMGKPPKKPLGG